MKFTLLWIFFHFGLHCLSSLAVEIYFCVVMHYWSPNSREHYGRVITFQIKPGSECCFRKSYPRLHQFSASLSCFLWNMPMFAATFLVTFLKSCCISKPTYPRIVSHATSQCQPWQDRRWGRSGHQSTPMVEAVGWCRRSSQLCHIRETEPEALECKSPGLVGKA